MKEILPDYDANRVYPSDIKKLIIWYNLLINSGFSSFEEIESEEDAKQDVLKLKEENKTASRKTAKTETKVKVETKKTSVPQKKLTGVKKNG